MSPYLFVLYMEYLSRLVSARVLNGSSSFMFHPQCKRVNLTYLIFADDLLLFSRGDDQSLKVLKGVMDEFSLVSGLQLNHRKSSMFLDGVTDRVKRKLLDIWGCNEGCFPVRYLGIPLSPKKLKVQEYDSLILRMTEKVQSWRAKLRSFAGRLQLVKSVLMSIQRFWSAILPLPIVVVRKVERICRNYLWSGVAEGRKALFAWKLVCQEYKSGGLQIKEVLGWNKCMMSMLVVKLFVPNQATVWTSWV